MVVRRIVIGWHQTGCRGLGHLDFYFGRFGRDLGAAEQQRPILGVYRLIVGWNQTRHAAAQAGQIYTSDATNYFSGGPGNKAQFQYVGNGVWQPLSQVAGPISLAQLPAGVVTNGEGGVNISGTFTGNGAGISNVNLLNVISDGAINWATNVSWGNFVLSSSVNVAGGIPASVTAADVNGDGYLDLITANENGNSLSVFTNNTAGGFALASTLTVPGAPYSVVAADVNGDGHVDLISADGPNNTLSVFTNDGTGNFVLSATPPVGNYPYAVCAADVNGDGFLDLICVNEVDATLTVLTNNRTGGFVLSATLPVGRAPISVVAADVNRDGHIDLICANLNGNTLTVLTNNGMLKRFCCCRPRCRWATTRIRSARWM